MPLLTLSPNDKLDAAPAAPEGFIALAPHESLDAPPAPQITGIGREIALPASAVAKGILQTIGLPGDVLRAGVHTYTAATKAAMDWLGIPGGNVLSGSNPLDSANLLRAGQALGLVDRPDLQPQTARERYEVAGAQGIGGTLPLVALGDVSAIPRTVLSGVGGGLGAELGAETMPAHPVVGGIVGGLAGGMVGGGLVTPAGKTINAAVGQGSPVVDAYRRLGMTPALAGDVTGSPLAQQVQAYSAKSPGGASVVAPAMQRTVSQFDNAVENTAQNLGNSRSAQAAGQALQEEARNWRDVVFPARQAAAWAPVDAAMAKAVVDPTNYRQALTDLSAKLAALPETQKALLPARTQKLLDAINTDVPAGGTMPWPQAQSLRSAIGEMMGVPKIADAIGPKQLSRAYGGISEDMRAAATANGAKDIFDQANAVSTSGHAFIDNVLSRFIKANNPAQETITPERAAEAALGGGDTVLQGVRAEMPRAADELAAYKLRDMSLATAGNAGRTGQETSPGTFLTDLNRLRQNAPAGTLALFPPGVTARINDLATVADHIKGTARLLNTANTGPTLAMGEMLLGALGGAQAGGFKGAAMGSVVPFAANKAVAYSVSRPWLTPFLATPGPTVPTLGNRLSTSAASAWPVIDNQLAAGQ